MAQAYPIKPIPQEPNSAALTGFILSLIGLLLCAPLVVVALGFCFVGLKKQPNGLAVAGTMICLLTFIIWTVVAVLGFTVFAVPFFACLGFASAVYDEEEKGLKDNYGNHPIVIRELGGVDTVEVSLEESGRYKLGNETTMVYNVKGPDGEGKFVVATQFDGDGTRITTRLLIDNEQFELGVQRDSFGSDAGAGFDSLDDDWPGSDPDW